MRYTRTVSLYGGINRVGKSILKTFRRHLHKLLTRSYSTEMEIEHMYTTIGQDIYNIIKSRRQNSVMIACRRVRNTERNYLETPSRASVFHCEVDDIVIDINDNLPSCRYIHVQ